MDDLLPSYQNAMQRDPLPFVAPYLSSYDLCSSALVCQKWYAAFTPHLWGNPAAHFGTGNDTVYVALTRFRRLLPQVRLYVREFTHTLYFQPAHAELYGEPHAEWLRDCLEYLPHLRCLLVNGFPFFDHASLAGVRHSSLRWRTAHPGAREKPPMYRLLLLDATSCLNATSAGLAGALCHFPDLVSLDLSRSSAAKAKIVFDILGSLCNLRVLSLRELGLKDADLSIIATSIAKRVKSLDLCGNHLTDLSAQLLVQYCMADGGTDGQQTARDDDLDISTHTRRAFRSENLANHLRKKLMEDNMGKVAGDEGRNTGITHLYLADNDLTTEGISDLIKTGRLQALDIANISISSIEPIHGLRDQNPSISKVLYSIVEQSASKLQYLKIDYKIVTEDAPAKMVSSRAEREAIAARVPELDSTESAVFELPDNPAYAVELPTDLNIRSSNQRGAPVSPVETLAPTSTVTLTKDGTGDRRNAVNSSLSAVVDSAFASYNPVSSEDSSRQDEFTRQSSNANPSLSPVLLCCGIIPEVMQARNGQTVSRRTSTHFVEDRRAHLDMRQAQEPRLHPGHLPKMSTLILTEVPTTTTDKRVIERLVQYIEDAAEETAIAKERAQHTYTLPPGRTRAIAEREHAHSLFALRRITLEMAPPQTSQAQAGRSWRHTKPSTEDADTEAFWEASKYDFSFFDDEECVVSRAEPGYILPLAAMNRLKLGPSNHVAHLESQKACSVAKPTFDVIAEIGKFRRERKAVYEQRMATEASEPDVKGYWSGEITIMRASPTPNLATTDYYGSVYYAEGRHR